MMQTLNHIELKWICSALQHEAESMESPADAALIPLANLAKENVLSVKRKIEAIIENNDKRIGVSK